MGRWVLWVAAPLVLWWRRGLEGCERWVRGRRGGGCRESDVGARGRLLGPSRRNRWVETRQILSKNSHPSVTDGCECRLRFEFAPFLGKVPHRSRKGRRDASRKGPGAGPGGARCRSRRRRRVGRRGGAAAPLQSSPCRRRVVAVTAVIAVAAVVAELVERRSNAGAGKILERPKPPPQSLCASSPHLPLLILYKATLVSRASPPQTYKNPSGSWGFPPASPRASLLFLPFL